MAFIQFLMHAEFERKRRREEEEDLISERQSKEVKITEEMDSEEPGTAQGTSGAQPSVVSTDGSDTRPARGYDAMQQDRPGPEEQRISRPDSTTRGRHPDRIQPGPEASGLMLPPSTTSRDHQPIQDQPGSENSLIHLASTAEERPAIEEQPGLEVVEFMHPPARSTSRDLPAIQQLLGPNSNGIMNPGSAFGPRHVLQYQPDPDSHRLMHLAPTFATRHANQQLPGPHMPTFAEWSGEMQRLSQRLASTEAELVFTRQKLQDTLWELQVMQLGNRQ